MKIFEKVMQVKAIKIHMQNVYHISVSLKKHPILSLGKYSADFWLVIFAYVGLLTLTLSYLVFIGYTTSDDVQIARQGFLEVWGYAQQAGRLTWVLSAPITLFSETQGSIWYSKILRIIWALALFHSAYLLVRERLLVAPTLLVLLFPIIFFLNDWDHHAFSSYPGLVIYGISCFLYSLHCFNIYLNSQKKVFLTLSLVLFCLSFITELFPSLFIFLIFYPSEVLKERVKSSIFHFIALILLVYFYIQFKGQVATYPLSINWLALEIWAVYSYSQIYTLSGLSISDILNFGSTFYIKNIISILFIMVIIYINFSDKRGDEYKANNYSKTILWWLSLSIWINIPVALTSRYQEWVAGGSQAYLYSALSNFTASIAIGLLFLVLLKRFNRLKFLIIVLTILILSIFTFHQMKSYIVFREQRYSHERWIYMDILAKRGLLKSDTCYIAPWLFELNGIVMIRSSNYWDQYLNQNWGLNTRILKSGVDPQCLQYEVLSEPRKRPT